MVLATNRLMKELHGVINSTIMCVAYDFLLSADEPMFPVIDILLYE
jgi:hypothetical protein